MREYLNLLNPERWQTLAHAWDEGLSTPRGKATVLSFVAAYAHAFGYSFEIFNTILARVFTPFHKTSLVVSELDFLEVLEFRARELERVMKGGSQEWRWPDFWPDKPPWNGPVTATAVENPRDPNALSRCLEETKRAIEQFKLFLGEGPFTSFGSDRHFDYIVRAAVPSVVAEGGFKIDKQLPEVIISYENPRLESAGLAHDEQGKWDTDRCLGSYDSQADRIRLHVRGISACARETGLREMDLLLIVLLHELGHFAAKNVYCVHKDVRRCLVNYDELAPDAHEAWAQLFVYHNLSSPACCGHVESFDALAGYQSAIYRGHQRILQKTREWSVILKSLPKIGALGNHAALEDWMKVI